MQTAPAAPSRSYYNPVVRTYFVSPNDPNPLADPGYPPEPYPPPRAINPEHEYISAIAQSYGEYPTHEAYIPRATCKNYLVMA